MHTVHCRLPGTGTTIFSTMSALAARCNAINLGQGFPDFNCSPALMEAVNQAMRSGRNQYAPMSGLPELRQAVAQKIRHDYGHTYDPDAEITITAGATEALFSAILAFTQPGDEVIVMDPSYDSYVPAIRMAGANPIRIPPRSDSLAPDIERLANALSSRTRLLIINSPNNPTSTIWTETQMQRLQSILAPTQTLLISDEVYEHIVFDEQRHESVTRYPALAERSLVVSSFGKSFHITGWKIGTIAAPAPLTTALRQIHQFNVFSVSTPMQAALAQYLQYQQQHPQDSDHYQNLSAFYQRKRDMFRNGLTGTGFQLLPCAGTYFQIADISELMADQRIQAAIQANAQTTATPYRPDDIIFCEWLTARIGVAAIPLSPFYADSPQSSIIRFCFAKADATLEVALQRLRGI